MVEIPFTILITFVIISFFMIVFGLFTRRMFGVYYMGTIIIVLTGVIWITMFAEIDTVSGIDSNFNTTTSSIPVTTDYMKQTTSNALLTLRNTQPIFAGQEIGNDNSLLNMKEINSLTFRLDRAGGNVVGKLYAGIWETQSIPSLSSSKFIIGEMLANGTSGTDATYTLTRNDTKTHILKVNEAIGIFFDSGDVANNIAIALNTTASSFDGANTYRTVFSEATNSWTDTTTHDFRFTVSLIKTQIAELNNSDKYDFNSVVKIYLVFFGVIIILTGGMYQLNGQRDKR